MTTAFDLKNFKAPSFFQEETVIDLFLPRELVF
jgi:hypothetical protein